MALLLATPIFLGGNAGFAAQQDMPRQDNTEMNIRDRDKSQPTADQQKENRGDRDLAAEIRKAIVDDKSLSTYAHNVKVIVQNGAVTLKGPVRSEQERKAVEAKAGKVAGAGKITNEITVEPEGDSKNQ
ncbi:MAG: BON domain-containing protein [Acidobacteria bacterium]|nr:BON domain-containing protein [Acidobacteriota bacterium]